MQVSVEECSPGEFFGGDPSTRRYLICGPSGTGKSFSSMFALNNWLPKYDEYVLISLTHDQEIYNSIRWSRIYPEFTQQAVAKEIYRQQCRKDRGIKKSVMLVMDDIIGSAKIRGNSGGAGVLEKVFSLGRHLNISCMVLLQRISVVSPVVRTNASIVMFRHTSETDIDMLYSTCGFSNKKTFRDVVGRVWSRPPGYSPFCFRYSDSSYYAGWGSRILVEYTRDPSSDPSIEPTSGPIDDPAIAPMNGPMAEPSDTAADSTSIEDPHSSSIQHSSSAATTTTECPSESVDEDPARDSEEEEPDLE